MSNINGKVICVIPARGGSKGIPLKNIRFLGGKPLIAYTLEVAIEAKVIDDVYVSTDDAVIATVSLSYGAKIIDRPAIISGDNSSSESALIHAIETLEHRGINIELVVFLQCTSPFREPSDIERAIECFRTENADSLLSVVPNHKFLWQIRGGVAQATNYDYNNRPRRQDMPSQYAENGSIYIFKPQVLRKFGSRLGGKVAIYIMREDQALDIDSEGDWAIAEFAMLRYKKSS